MRRMYAAQLERAARRLERQAATDKAIHKVRQELKRARATLRLLRDGFGVTAYRRDNRLVRDVARPLSRLRDATVLIETFDRCGGPAGTLRETLCAERDLSRRHVRIRDMAASARRLRRVGRRALTVTDERLARADIDRGLKRAYRKVRAALARARERNTDEALHEWRKQVKYLVNQLAIGCPRASKRIRRLTRRSGELSDRLGDDHDLAVLCGKIELHLGTAAERGEDAVLQGLLRRLRRDRKHLQRQAFGLGRRLYASAPRRFRASLRR